MRKLLFTLALITGVQFYGQTQSCTGPLTVTVNGSATGDVISAMETHTAPSCNEDSGTADGTITPVPAGGTSPYVYDWGDITGTDDGANRTALGAGDYNVTITDANGCSTTLGPITLEEPDAVEITEMLTQLNCNSASGDPNGAISITVVGGTEAGDYDYLWSTMNGSGLVATDQNQTELTAGDYTVLVTDDNGCTATGTYTLTEPTPVACTATSPTVGTGGTNILCTGGTGTIEVAASGGSGMGYTYSTNGTDFQASSTFTDVLAGAYTVTTMDGAGCISTCMVTLTEPTPLVAGSCDYVQDLCQLDEGEIKIEASGGVAPYSVSWSATPVAPNTTAGSLDQSSPQVISASGGSITFTGATGNNQYSFMVTDANGCEIP